MRVELRIELDVGSVAGDRWDAVVPDGGFFSSHAWLRATADDPSVTSRYLVASLGDEIVGNLALFDTRFELSPYYRAEQFVVDGKAFTIAGSRRGFRSVCSTSANVADATRAEVTRALGLRAGELASQDGVTQVIWPYMTESDAWWMDTCLSVDVTPTQEEAVLRLPGSGFEDYLSMLSGRRRRSIRNEMRRASTAGHTTAREAVPNDLRKLATMAVAVERKYGRNATERGMSIFLQSRTAALGDAVVLMSVRAANGRLLAYTISYRWRDEMYVRLVGMDYDEDDDVFAYFHAVFYGPISYAYDVGVRTLYYGIEALHTKVVRGADREPLYHVVCAGPSSRLTSK